LAVAVAVELFAAENHFRRRRHAALLGVVGAGAGDRYLLQLGAGGAGRRCAAYRLGRTRLRHWGFLIRRSLAFLRLAGGGGIGLLLAAGVRSAARRADHGEAGNPDQFAHAFLFSVAHSEKAF
jgi:hypothetical protein